MSTASKPYGINPTRTAVVYLAALFAYTVAVLQRTSFGVVGLEAAQRFSAGASVVSMFVVLQLLVYALGQVPAGLLADRFGSRAVITTGALVMMSGQVILAFTDSVPVAIAGRALVALGDSFTWTPTSRLLPQWFSARWVPLATQMTAILGATGQLLSAFPFAALVHTDGWTTGLLGAAAVGLLAACLAFLCIRNAPAGAVVTTGPRPGGGTRGQLFEVLRQPGTQTAFFGHWVASSWSMNLIMMWGQPFLVQGEGYTPAQAGSLFVWRWAASAASGLVQGYMTGRHPLRRSTLVLIGFVLGAAPWVAVLAWPGQAPYWLLALMCLGSGAAEPGGNVSYDIARTANRKAHTGTATGVVVMGGFISCLVTTWMIGLTLDLLGGGYTRTDFRIAMSTQFVMQGLGLAAFLRARGRARRLDTRTNGTVFLPWRDVIARERQRWRDQHGGDPQASGR
ncbi:MFS transporter [Brooklawnia cerclae]|uniref:Sugar phosphate permease n=1 Tax=Brooklawnia cerclae TaxID=349934 RepID=A0ABX0SJS9_9ACTN|nr:sugar phosphate permease [Brooklawnia cerclae]